MKLRFLPALAALSLFVACGDPPADTPEVTWYRDVLPIAQTQCTSCHATGGIGTFSMLSYEDVKPWAGKMADEVEAGTMPPWKPAPGCGTFEHERTLTSEEIAVFRAWADAGAPEGDVADKPAAPPARDELAWVDQIVEPAADYVPSGQVADDYHCFILDPQLSADQHVIGMDVQPGSTRMVHHVILFQAPRTGAEAKEAADTQPGPGWSCYGSAGISGEEVVGVWVPGSPVITYPETTGVVVPKDNVYVMQVHYNTAAGEPVADRTKVKLQYAKTPVARPAKVPVLLDTGFSIPAGATGYTYEFSYTSPITTRLWGLMPHMHQLGVSMKVWMEEKDIDTGLMNDVCLIDIPEWDFEWQQNYMYTDPEGILVPAGSVLHISCTWDNPGDQPVNFGEGTSDEMCLSFFYVTQP